MVCQQTPKKQILQKQWGGYKQVLKCKNKSGNIIVGSILKVAKFLSNNPYGM